jgi:homoserine kinase
VAAQDGEMLRHAMDDKMHEPYRQELVPELGQLRKLLRSTSTYGCVLSGAGPTIMVVAHRKDMAEVHHVLKEWTAKQKNEPRILNLQVDQKGLQAINE